jgi:hypothetical protein
MVSKGVIQQGFDGFEGHPEGFDGFGVIQRALMG